MPRIFKDFAIWSGPYALAAKTKEVSLDYSCDEKDVTSLVDSTVISFPGLMKVSASIKGFTDHGTVTASAHYIDPIMFAAIGEETGVGLTMAIDGGDSGDICFFFTPNRMKYSPISGSVGDIHEFEVSASNASGRLVRGKVALPSGSVSGASGNGTGYQLGALSATQKLYAALHVFDVSSGGSVVFKVQSDDNAGFTTPTDRITFVAATGATWENGNVAGAITDDYWRVTYARTGGATFNAALSFGIGPA